MDGLVIWLAEHTRVAIQILVECELEDGCAAISTTPTACGQLRTY